MVTRVQKWTRVIISTGLVQLDIGPKPHPIRVTASICVKFLFYFSIKTYFSYFIRSLLQNTHIRLFIIYPFLFKYSFFIILTFIFSHTLSLILISHTFSHLSVLLSSKFRPPQNFPGWTSIAKTQIATTKANLHGRASISFIYWCCCLPLLLLLNWCCHCFFFFFATAIAAASSSSSWPLLLLLGWFTYICIWVWWYGFVNGFDEFEI